MWVEELPNGKFKYCERYLDHKTGKNKRVSITLDKNTAQARNHAVKVLNKKIEDKNKNSKEKPSITFGELAKEWIKLKSMESIKPSTLTAYNNRLVKILDKIADEPINTLSASTINKVIKDLAIKQSYKTTNERVKLIKNIFDYAVKYGHLEYDHLSDKIVQPKINQDPVDKNDLNFLEKDEWEVIFNKLGEKSPIYQTVFKLQLQTGMRFNEVTALTVDDISGDKIDISKNYDIKNKVFTLPKGNEPRTIYINDETKYLLETYLSNRKALQLATGYRGDLLFFGRNGSPISITHANRLLHSVEDDKRLTTHIFRHTFITQAISNGMPVGLVSKHVGHKSEEITKRVYQHFSNKMDKDLREEIRNLSFG